MKKYLVILGITMLLLSGCTAKNNYKALEEELKEKATKYYQDYIEGKVLGFDEHRVSLEALEKAEVDISNFKKKYCDKSSYASIKLKYDDNNEPTGEFEVENHLTCGEYTTKKK